MLARLAIWRLGRGRFEFFVGLIDVDILMHYAMQLPMESVCRSMISTVARKIYVDNIMMNDDYASWMAAPAY